MQLCKSGIFSKGGREVTQKRVNKKSSLQIFHDYSIAKKEILLKSDVLCALEMLLDSSLR